MIFQSRFISFNKVIVSNVSDLTNFSLSGSILSLPLRGGAPKGRKGEGFAKQILSESAVQIRRNTPQSA